jgi:hypothetical protein
VALLLNRALLPLSTLLALRSEAASLALSAAEDRSGVELEDSASAGQVGAHICSNRAAGDAQGRWMYLCNGLQELMAHLNHKIGSRPLESNLCQAMTSAGCQGQSQYGQNNLEVQASNTSTNLDV